MEPASRLEQAPVNLEPAFGLGQRVKRLQVDTHSLLKMGRSLKSALLAEIKEQRKGINLLDFLASSGKYTLAETTDQVLLTQFKAVVCAFNVLQEQLGGDMEPCEGSLSLYTPVSQYILGSMAQTLKQMTEQIQNEKKCRIGNVLDAEDLDKVIPNLEIKRNQIIRYQSLLMKVIKHNLEFLL